MGLDLPHPRRPIPAAPPPQLWKGPQLQGNNAQSDGAKPLKFILK
jgi:hypothetical protein